MNKRSALLVSAGLVLTLIVGGLAVAVGLTGDRDCQFDDVAFYGPS